MEEQAAASAGPSGSGRQLPFPAWLVPVILAFPIAAILIVLQQGASAWQLQLGDSDNYMRLVEIRDFLAGQGWYDLVQHRIDPPHGLHSHWSRLADLPYVVSILLLRPFLGPELAERVAIVSVPPLLLLLATIAVSRLAHRLAGLPAAFCACLLLAVSAPVLAQFVPGRIDHHGLQILLLVSAACAAAGPDRRRSGLAAAAACSVSLAIGLETAPYLALVAAWTAARWLILGPGGRAKATGFFAGLAVLVPALLALTVSPADWPAAHADQLSGGHVVAVLAGSLALLAAMAVPGADRLGIRLAGAAVAVAAVLAVLSRFPQLVSEPYANVDPLMRRLWIENVSETRSFADIWSRSPLLAVGQIWFVAASGLAGWWLALRVPAKRDGFVLLALLATMGAALAVWEARGDSAATAIAVPVAGALLGLWGQRWQSGQASVLPFAAAAMLLNPIIVFAASNLAQGATGGRQPAARAAVPLGIRCDRPADLAELGRLPAGPVLSPIDQSAKVLARTRHSVVTAANHRNAGPNGWAYHVFAGGEAAAQRLIRARRVDYVAYCPGASEVRNIVRFAPGGLLAGLQAGRVPDWLVPVGSPANGRLAIFRVRPPPRANQPANTVESRNSQIETAAPAATATP